MARVKAVPSIQRWMDDVMMEWYIIVLLAKTTSALAIYHPSTSIYLPSSSTNCLFTYLYRNLLHPLHQLNHGYAYGLVVTNVVRVFGLFIVLKPRGLTLKLMSILVVGTYIRIEHWN